MAEYFGLYYPFIHFRDESWLKLTSLFWDRMGRIVPADYSLRDSATVREFKDGGYVADYEPRGDAQAETVRAFQTVIGTHGERLVQRYGLHLSQGWPNEPSTVQSRAAQFGNPRLAYVFGPKLSPRLIDDLETLGLAERGGRRDPHWIGMHPRLAAVYMTYLAGGMAARRNALPVSDDLLSHIGVGEPSMAGMAEALLSDDDRSPSGDAHEAEMLMAGLAIETVVPANLDGLPANRILHFRERYATERAAFQDQVRAMVASLDVTGIQESDALREHLQNQYEKLLKPQVADLKRSLRASRIDTTTAVFNVKTNPAGYAGGVSLGLLQAPEPLVAAGAVALSVWSVYREYRRNRRAILAEHLPASYLYQLETNLSARGLADRVSRLGRRFSRHD